MSKPDQPPRGRPGLGEYERALRAVLHASPVAYHAAIGKALNSATAGVFLCQLLYWQPRGRDPDGWIWKTREEIYEETALTRYEQEGARKVLVARGVLEEARRGVPARMHFRVDLVRLVELLDEHHGAEPANGARTYRAPAPAGDGSATEAFPVQLGEKPPSSRRKTRQPEGGKPANQKAENPPTITETTSEITQETTHHHAAPGTPGPAPAPGGGDEALLACLVDRGITRGVARRLVAEHDRGAVALQIERHDRLKAAGSRLLSRNPAGYLRSSIEDDYPEPAEYARLVADEAKRRRAEEAAKLAEYEEWQREQERLREDALWHAEEPEARAERRVEQHAEMLRRIKRPAMAAAEREERRAHLVAAFRNQAVEFFTRHPGLEAWAREQLDPSEDEPAREPSTPAKLPGKAASSSPFDRPDGPTTAPFSQTDQPAVSRPKSALRGPQRATTLFPPPTSPPSHRANPSSLD